MELLEIMRRRRSIRKFESRKVEREKLDKILEAGIYAPSPGGRQGTTIALLENEDLIEKIGIINANCENRNWGGSGVSAEQPSIIDDLSIRSGFYGCQALAIIFVPESMAEKVNGIGSAFVCAENMVLEAYDLGVSSCIVGRAKDTFSDPEISELLNKWEIDTNLVPMVFVCLGYIRGEYPKVKERKEGRILYL